MEKSLLDEGDFMDKNLLEEREKTVKASKGRKFIPFTCRFEECSSFYPSQVISLINALITVLVLYDILITRYG